MPKLLLAVLFFVVGCGLLRPAPLAISPGEVSRFGEPPKNVEEISLETFQRVAKDPESVRIGSVTTPRPGYLMDYHGNWAADGWVWQATVNAKNSFGGYGGFENFFFFRSLSGQSACFKGAEARPYLIRAKQPPAP